MTVHWQRVVSEDAECRVRMASQTMPSVQNVSQKMLGI